MVRVHFGPPLLKKRKVGVKTLTFEFQRRSRQNGLERRLLTTVRWTVVTAVAFPQKSESWPTTSSKLALRGSHGTESSMLNRKSVFPLQLKPATLGFQLVNMRVLRIDWNPVMRWDFIESLRFKLHLENWTLLLWCNYEKATVKDNFFRVNTILAKRKLLMSLHNSTIKRTKNLDESIDKVKLIRAQGECLGIRSRWRTW